MSETEELRLAAKLLRERAEAATPGPWQHMCLGSEGCLVLRNSGTVRERGRGRVAAFRYKDHQADHADAEFAAGMHPGVALAVANWLASFEPRLDDREYEADDWNAAIKIARAYLGTGNGEG